MATKEEGANRGRGCVFEGMEQEGVAQCLQRTPGFVEAYDVQKRVTYLNYIVDQADQDFEHRAHCTVNIVLTL